MASSEEKVYIGHPSGARACIELHGAHLTSWKTANGQEQVFVSKQAVFKPPKAIRGGVPICFPQFSDFGNLKTSHGFARNTRWKLFEREGDTVVLKLNSSDDDFLDKYGCEDSFTISVRYTITNTQLFTKLMVTNTGCEEMVYTVALHTYFPVEDITKARVEGLYRVGYLDSLDGRLMKTEENPYILINEEVDRIYLSTPPTLRLVDPIGKKVVTIEKFNLPDIVVWNPWVEKAKRLSDFGDNEYKEMLCVETGHIKPAIRLAPGTVWKSEQILTVVNNGAIL
ncbi:glycoside hydrolase [Chloropicon primus]|uniref:glucose-6-phosphate 1-epimerase n=1 Tax=Chloropicon primus TaxID=1764295 RepID=A0A5B8MJQ1_9CHLO|nr:glycoside hydrolase [Chloropicon primus]UPQ99126.1 glycoside hydrolase [Chloropicon primus]|eukprot:QDZ19915.1 glycoside hydrolase [Chloropicon primus]